MTAKGGSDARIARDRCLDALAGCTDLETRKSLWRAAMRYHERVLEGRGERAGELNAPSPLQARRDDQGTQAACMFEFRF